MHFDYTYIQNPEKLAKPDGGGYCSKLNDTVHWQGRDFTCQEKDVLAADDARKKTITETFDNVKKYLEATLKVDPLDYQITLKKEADWYPLSQEKPTEIVDFYVTLYPYPHDPNSATIMTGMFVQQDGTTKRPNQGIVVINVAQCPTASSDFTSTVGGRKYFEVALHEIVHALGVSKLGLQHWINPETKQSYGQGKEPVKEYTLPSSKKKFAMLATPKLVSLFNKRWGNDNPEMPAGIELEVDENGAWGSHWHARVYYNELMVAPAFPYYRISEITLTALEDSGWYDADFSRAEPLEWGDYRSIIDARPFKNFPLGSPDEWPNHYVLRKIPENHPEHTDIKGCTYDHRAVGKIAPQKNDCGDGGAGTREDAHCAYPDFYDPHNLGWYGSAQFDYVLVLLPTQVCVQTPSKPDSNAYYGQGSMCAMRRDVDFDLEPEPTCLKMSCNEDNWLSVYVGDKPINCSKEGDTFVISADKYEGICPNPKIVCGIINYAKNSGGGDGGGDGGDGGGTGSGGDGGDGTGGGGDNSDGDGTPGKGLGPGAIAGIVIACVVVVGAVVTVVVLAKKGVICKHSAQIVAS